MRNAILAKLDAHLQAGINREADVVYLLVEIGKYLEQRHDEQAGFAEWPQYPLLRFYRNWIAHSFVGDTQSADPMPTELEAATRTWLEAGDAEVARDQVGAAITWGRLRDEMQRFLEAHDLGRTLTNADASWRALVALLLSVLADNPLVFRNFTFLQLFGFHQLPGGGVVWRLRAAGQDLEGPMGNP